MIPAEAREILTYYGAALGFALLLFVSLGRKKKGMRLRLKGGSTPPPKMAEPERENIFNIGGSQSQSPEKFSHINTQGERPLNVVFNYNGHSWDAYEILGLPAGSAPDKVEHAYREALKSVDAGSKSFLEAAYRAIQSEWKIYKQAK